MDNLMKSKRFNIYLMYLIAFFQGLVFYGPIAAIYRLSRGITMYQIFLIESIFWILMVVLEIPWGYFADRFGYKKTLLISNVIFFISKVVFYKAFSFHMFVVERILLAIAISSLSGCDTAMLYGSSEDGESQKAFGIYNASAAAGYLIASLMSTVMIGDSLDKAGLYTVFPYGIAIILTIFIKDVQIQINEKVNIKDSFKNVMDNKPLIILVIAMAFIREVYQAASVFLNQLQYTRTGIDIRYFGILAVVIQVLNLSSARSHILSNKLGKNKSIGMLIISMIMCCFSLIFVQSRLLSVACIMLISGSMSLMNPIVLEIQNKGIITGDRATMLSIYAMSGNVVAAMINPLIGMAADISVQTAFGTCVLIACCGFGLFLVYEGMDRNRRNHHTT